MTNPESSESQGLRGLRGAGRRTTLTRWAGPLVFAACGAGLLAWTWGTWPDVFVDFGRELYVPWQLAAGKVLYRDVAYFNGPLSPYFNSLWFRAFGARLLTLVIVNIGVLAVLVCLLYRILGGLTDRSTATAACVFFLGVFACGQIVGIGNYNFICPYSHELTHGIVLSLAAIQLLSMYVCRRRPIWLAAAGGALGLVFLTKAEVFLAAAAALAVGFALTLRAEQRAGRPIARRVALFVGCAAIPPALAFALLGLAMPAAGAARATIGSWRSLLAADVASLRFYRSGMGLDAPLENLTMMFAWVVKYAAVFVPAGALALLLRKRGAYRVGVATALFVVIAAWGVWPWDQIKWFQAARPLPLFLLAAGVWLAAAYRKARDVPDRERSIAGLTLVTFAGVLLVKMLLNVRVYHYGFAIAMPAALVLVAALLGWLPRLIDRLGGYGGVFRAIALGVLIPYGAAHVRTTHGWLVNKTLRIGTGSDAFWADPRGEVAALILDQIAQHFGPDETLVVLPEGAILNYLSRRVNPTPYINFMPPELLIFGEERILEALQRHPPDGVVLLHKDTSEYGFRFFGRDYGQRLYAWVTENYRPVSNVAIGAWPFQDERFGAAVMRRASSANR